MRCRRSSLTDLQDLQELQAQLEATAKATEELLSKGRWSRLSPHKVLLKVLLIAVLSSTSARMLQNCCFVFKKTKCWKILTRVWLAWMQNTAGGISATAGVDKRGNDLRGKLAKRHMYFIALT